MIQIPNSLRQIGPGFAPFIIAEVGSNWSTLDDCIYSIAMAKACGADAVKFQLYDYKALYGPRFVTPSPDLTGSLPQAWLPKLKTHADKVGIEFMCSAFSPELLHAVDPYVNVHKLASAEMTHVRMLEKLAEFGKPVIMSTGASGVEDIRESLRILGETPTILLYCVAAYPAREVDLGTIDDMRIHFGYLVGFSDHTTDAGTIPLAAIQMGACVLEKHVDFVGSTGPDAPHSLSADEFGRLIKRIRGDRNVGGSVQERPMILRHNRRLLATTQINAGDTLQEGVNFGIYRSLKDDTHAYSPFMINRVIGQVLKRDVKAGDGIGPGDV